MKVDLGQWKSFDINPLRTFTAFGGCALRSVIAWLLRNMSVRGQKLVMESMKVKNEKERYDCPLTFIYYPYCIRSPSLHLIHTLIVDSRSVEPRNQISLR